MCGLHIAGGLTILNCFKHCICITFLVDQNLRLLPNCAKSGERKEIMLVLTDWHLDNDPT